MSHREESGPRRRRSCRPNGAGSTFTWAPVAAAVLALGAHSGAVLAQGTAETAEDKAADANTLPSVTVTASPDRGTSVTKLPQSIKDTPQSVTVIDKERMDEQNLRTLDDVMQQSPGVTVQPYTLLTTGYYARGFKIDSFEQDGVPILMGNTASPPQDMSMYERVEIVRGQRACCMAPAIPRPPSTWYPSARNERLAPMLRSVWAVGTVTARRLTSVAL